MPEFILVICCNKKFNFQTMYNYILLNYTHFIVSLAEERGGMTKSYISFFSVRIFVFKLFYTVVQHLQHSYSEITPLKGL